MAEPVDRYHGRHGWPFLAGQLRSPLLGIGTINDAVTIPTMLVTLAGSIFMIWIVKLVHR